MSAWHSVEGTQTGKESGAGVVGIHPDNYIMCAFLQSDRDLAADSIGLRPSRENSGCSRKIS